jgi:hypothetical protein
LFSDRSDPKANVRDRSGEANKHLVLADQLPSHSPLLAEAPRATPREPEAPSGSAPQLLPENAPTSPSTRRRSFPRFSQPEICSGVHPSARRSRTKVRKARSLSIPLHAACAIDRLRRREAASSAHWAACCERVRVRLSISDDRSHDGADRMVGHRAGGISIASTARTAVGNLRRTSLAAN